MRSTLTNGTRLRGPGAADMEITPWLKGRGAEARRGLEAKMG